MSFLKIMPAVSVLLSAIISFGSLEAADRPSVTCLVWAATDEDFGHVGLHTGKYYVSFWPDRTENDAERVLEEGVEGCLVYHPFLDRSYEGERKPMQFVVDGISGQRIDAAYEEMLRHNGVRPEDVTFIAGEGKRDLYGAGADDAHRPQISLARSRWSYLGQHIGDDPEGFYRRNQSCTTMVLSLLRIGDDVVNGCSLDDVIPHHTTDQRRLLGFAREQGVFGSRGADRLPGGRNGALSRTLLGLSMHEVGGLVSVPNFIGILAEWNLRSRECAIDMRGVAAAVPEAAAIPVDNLLRFLGGLESNASIRRSVDIAGTFVRGVVITKLNLSKMGIGDSGCENLSSMHSLTWLNLYDNNVHDRGARSLSRLLNLTYLDLGWNDIGTDGIRAISQLGLKELNLYKNYVYPENIQYLGSMASLVTLNLRKSDGKYLTDNDVYNLVHPLRNQVLLVNLENLSLNKAWNGVTDTCIEYLLELPNLKKVDVRNTSVTSAGKQRLRNRNIEVMHDDNGITYPYQPEIAGGVMSLNTGNRVNGSHFLFA